MGHNLRGRFGLRVRKHSETFRPLCGSNRTTWPSAGNAFWLRLQQLPGAQSLGNLNYGMIARVLHGVLKWRYLVVFGAIYGGVSLNNRYEKWKSGLLDMGWIKCILPSDQQSSGLSKNLISIRDSIEPDPRLKKLGAYKLEEWRKWFYSRLEDTIETAAEAKRTKHKEKRAEWRKWYDNYLENAIASAEAQRAAAEDKRSER